MEKISVAGQKYRLDFRFVKTMEPPYIYLLIAPLEWVFASVVLDLLLWLADKNRDPILAPSLVFFVVYLQTLYLIEIRSTMGYSVYLSKLVSGQRSDQTPVLNSRMPLIDACLHSILRVGNRHSNGHFEDLVLLRLKERHSQVSDDISFEEIIHAIKIGIVDLGIRPGDKTVLDHLKDFSDSVEKLIVDGKTTVEDMCDLVVSKYVALPANTKVLARISFRRRHRVLGALEAHVRIIEILIAIIVAIATILSVFVRH